MHLSCPGQTDRCMATCALSKRRTRSVWHACMRSGRYSSRLGWLSAIQRVIKETKMRNTGNCPHGPGEKSTVSSPVHRPCNQQWVSTADDTSTISRTHRHPAPETCGVLEDVFRNEYDRSHSIDSSCLARRTTTGEHPFTCRCRIRFLLAY